MQLKILLGRNIFKDKQKSKEGRLKYVRKDHSNLLAETQFHVVFHLIFSFLVKIEKIKIK